MPPESLSTTAVMKPGPRTARKTSRWRLKRAKSSVTEDGARLSLSQHGDHVIGGYRSRQSPVFGNNGQRQQIIFVEQLSHAVAFLVRCRRDKPFGRELNQPCPSLGQKQPCQ